MPTKGNMRYLEVVQRYMQANELIDEWQLWANPPNVPPPSSLPHANVICLPRANVFTAPFYAGCQDHETIYIKADDDVIWWHPLAIQRLLDLRIDDPRPFVISANVVNNGLCSHLHQANGAIDDRFGKIKFDSSDRVAYKNIQFCAYLHNAFLGAAEVGETSTFYFATRTLVDYNYFSINCFAFFGKDWDELGDQLVPHGGDEGWISQIHPRNLKRPVKICGNALVVHYAFCTQRDQGIDKRTDLLDRYDALSKRVLI
jgi:hypothetical protein